MQVILSKECLGSGIASSVLYDGVVSLKIETLYHGYSQNCSYNAFNTVLIIY